MMFMKEAMASINVSRTSKSGGSHVGAVCSVLTSFYQAKGKQKPEPGCALTANNEEE